MTLTTCSIFSYREENQTFNMQATHPLLFQLILNTENEKLQVLGTLIFLRCY